MTILTDQSLEFAREHIQKFYDSDFFPKPVEFEALWHQWEAVSYTHLRAHETVLKLVCRLLLDKKQKKRRLTVEMTECSMVYGGMR